MAKVVRTLVYKGVFTVECGRGADGESPAHDLLKLLLAKQWVNSEAEKYPDEKQASFYIRLRDLLKRLAQDEELPLGTYNRLDDGVWELKVNNLRLTFYDTDGVGGYVPKHGTRKYGWDGKHYWELPYDFCDDIRLGTYFEKDDEQAPPAEVARSIEFREEDLSHDR